MSEDLCESLMVKQPQMDGDDPKVSYVFDTKHYLSQKFEFRLGHFVSISEDLGLSETTDRFKSDHPWLKQCL